MGWSGIPSRIRETEKSITILLKQEGVRLKIHERIKLEDMKLN